MIGNIKKPFLSRTEMQKKQVLQDPGYVEGVKGSCYMLHASLQEVSHVKSIKRNINKQNRLDLRPLFLMSVMDINCKVLSSVYSVLNSSPSLSSSCCCCK